MKRITYKQVKALASCKDQPEKFKEFFGNSVFITEEVVETALKEGFHLTYLCYSMIVIWQETEVLDKYFPYWCRSHEVSYLKSILPKPKKPPEELLDWHRTVNKGLAGEYNYGTAKEYYEFLKSF